jgi:erythronate-4-phosphate dehydrogenase
METGKPISVIIDEAIPFIRGFAEPFANVMYMAGNSIDSHHLKSANALIIRTRTICDSSLLEGTPVSLIGTATIGYDHIDTEYCKLKRIKWSSAPGCNSGSVMQYITAALLHLCVKYGLEPSGLTLGVVGVGHVGTKVAAAASSLGMRVILNDPPRQRVGKLNIFTPLNRLLGESDIVTLHVPLTLTGRDATFHLAGREVISAMKRGAFLINTSRGGITDEDAVKRALLSGQLRGYIADVWSGEPAADQELIDMAEIATPHIAGYSADGKLNGSRMVLSALADHFSIPILLPGKELLPSPENNSLFAGLGDEGVSETLYGIVKQTCDIASESRLFKSEPKKFEAFRNNYPPRREFGAYNVTGDQSAVEVALKLGFTT